MGIVNVPNREEPELTQDKCIRAARQIAEGAHRLGINLARCHALERMRLDAQWLSDMAPQAFAHGGTTDRERDRYMRASIRMEQALRLGEALSMAGNIQYVEEFRRFLTDMIDRLGVEGRPGRVPQGINQQALDHLLEFEVAARIARHGHAVSAREPDVLVRYTNGGELGIAVKRPRRVQGVDALINEGRRQIIECRERGLILVGMEAIFHGTDRIRIAAAPTEEQGRAEGARLIGEAIAAADEAMERAFGDGVVAVLFFGAFCFTLAETFHGVVLARGAWNAGAVRAEAELERLKECLVP